MVKRSRSPGRFTHRGVNSPGSCSDERGNVLGVGNYCYVAVWSAALGASAPIEGVEGRGITWRPSARLQLVFHWIAHFRGQVNKLCERPPQYAPAPASWPLTFWPWKWCPSHVWRGLPLCQLGLSGLDLGPMYATDRRRQSGLEALTSLQQGTVRIVAVGCEFLYSCRFARCSLVETRVELQLRPIPQMIKFIRQMTAVEYKIYTKEKE